MPGDSFYCDGFYTYEEAIVVEGKGFPITAATIISNSTLVTLAVQNAVSL